MNITPNAKMNNKFLKNVIVFGLIISMVAAYFFAPAPFIKTKAAAETINMSAPAMELNTYKNSVPAFSMNYPKNWYFQEINDDNSSAKLVIFSNYEKPLQAVDKDIPQDFLSYDALIMPKNEIPYEQLMKQKDQIAQVADEEINYTVSEDKTIDLYVITKGSEQVDASLAPFAIAFLEDENYMYIFSMTTGIPSGAAGQMKEIEELKKSLESFKFNEAEKFSPFKNNSVL